MEKRKGIIAEAKVSLSGESHLAWKEFTLHYCMKVCLWKVSWVSATILQVEKPCRHTLKMWIIGSWWLSDYTMKANLKDLETAL